MKRAALKLIEQLHSELIALAQETHSTGETDTGFEKLKRWKIRAAKRIAEEINPIEGANLAEKRKMSFRMGDPIGNFDDEAQMYEGFLVALQDDIKAHADEVLGRPVAEAIQKEPIVFETAKGKSCFYRARP